MIDSDLAKVGDSINATKTRINQECENSGVLCWITEGREVENYLPLEAIAAVYDKPTGVSKSLALGPFERIHENVETTYKESWKPSFAYERHKADFSRLIAAEITSLRPL